MKKISSVVVGIPLKQSSPAAIERYLLEKVRNDLGEYADLATVKPMLRIDQEDGDLTGNVTDGYGNVVLDIQGVKLHLPFIIHQKELIPFDVIRMGEQEVSYDISKLRRLVNEIDKRVKETAGNDMQNEGITEVVDPKEISYHNGFLGTIMDVRDSHRTKDVNGVGLFDGLDFGNFDEGRLIKSASAKVDVADTFSQAIEKIAAVQTISKANVNDYLDQLWKDIKTESERQIAEASGTKEDSLEQAKIRRSISQLHEEALVDVRRAASGNNIKFPVSDDTRFEYRSGRVYHKLTQWGNPPSRPYVTKYTSLVLDNKGGFKLLRDKDKFMTTLQAVDPFNMPVIDARAMQLDAIYTTEIKQDEVAFPFKVTMSYIKNCEDDGIVVSVRERKTNPGSVPIENSLFVDSFGCQEIAESVENVHGNEYESELGFNLIISRKPIDKVMSLTKTELLSYIQEHATDTEDAKLARYMATSCYFAGETYYVIPENLKMFKLEKNILGNFTKPNGYMSEGPMAKTAAFNRNDSATLLLTKKNQPRAYALEWQYTDKVEGTGDVASFNIKKHKRVDLTEEQSRKLLSDLGFDAGKQVMFFEIIKRNGRSARFPLPDLDKAKNAAPEDKATNKVKKALSNIANGTLNSRNFTPIFETVISDGLANMIGNAAPDSIDWVKSWDGVTKSAYETAVEIEKVANAINGPTWHELSLLTNLKYRLDKMASSVFDGAYLTGTEEVFQKVAEMYPAIEKTASELISFNRTQITEADKPIVNPLLVKQALHELDGLCKYASLSEKGLKKNDFLNKEAAFVNRKTLNGKLKQFDSLVSTAQKSVDDVQSKIRKDYIYLRSLQQSDKPTAAKELKVEQNISSLKTKLDEEVEKLNHVVSQKAEVNADLRSKNMGIAAGAGLPGLAGLSYGYQEVKNK